jgi:cell wall-associated NlpC family hydrolase
MLAGTAVVAPQVGADQLASERAQAQALVTRIDQLGRQEAALSERYDGALITLHQADARVAAATKAMAIAQAGQARTLTLLRTEAVQAYVGGGPEVELVGGAPLKDVEQALFRQELIQSAASNEQQTLDQYRLAMGLEGTAHQQLTAARNADAAVVGQLEKDRLAVQAAQDKLVASENQVNGRIASLVAEIRRQQLLAAEREAAARLEAERAAAAQAAAEAAAAARQAQLQAEARQRQAVHAQDLQVPVTTVPSQTPPTTPSQAPPSSSGAAAAVAAAESRVGDPYVWGAAGPGAFDCSGLVEWAWAQAGVYLPHYSGAQYADTTHIPMSDLQPGDLVFPADPGEHVAMYVGNGEIVEAPYTGAYVHVVPLSSFFVLASRVG